MHHRKLILKKFIKTQFFFKKNSYCGVPGREVSYFNVKKKHGFPHQQHCANTTDTTSASFPDLPNHKRRFSRSNRPNSTRENTQNFVQDKVGCEFDEINE